MPPTRAASTTRAALLTPALLLFPGSLAAAQEDATQPERTSHLGEYAGTVAGLAAPRAVAFDGQGQLWVALGGDVETPPSVVPVALSIDGETGETKSDIGVALGADLLRSPSGVATDAAGHVFVSDEEAHGVWRFDAEGQAKRLCDFGPSAGQVVAPQNLAIGVIDGAEALVVCDTGNGRVQVLDPETGASRATLTGPLVRPSAACVMTDGTIVVVDGARQKLDRFSAAGQHMRAFSDWGSFPSLISTPLGIASLNGLVFVADTENHRVQAFDPAQELPLAYRFGVHAIRPGEGEGKLHYPYDLAIRGDGDLLAVPEPLDDRVQLFKRAPGAEPVEDPLRAGLGGPSAHFGPFVSASGQFLVTCSPESHKVQLHDMRLEQPIKIAELFGYGTRLGMLRGPSGLWLDDEGKTLLVTDVGNRRLTRVRLKVKPEEDLGQQPDIAVYEDAVDFGRLDFSSIGSVARGGAEAPPVPIIPGPVCQVRQGETTYIVVADNGNEALIVLDERLQPVEVIGGDLGLAGPLGKITGLAAAQGTLYVSCDCREGSMSVPSGASLYEFWLRPKEMAGPSLFEMTARGSKAPQSRLGGVAVRGDELFVTDSTACAMTRLGIMDPESRGLSSGADDELVPRMTFGSKGIGRHQFNDPRGLAVLGDGRLVVIDHGNHRGQIFDAEGNFVTGFGSRLYTLPLR